MNRRMIGFGALAVLFAIPCYAQSMIASTMSRDDPSVDPYQILRSPSIFSRSRELPGLRPYESLTTGRSGASQGPTIVGVVKDNGGFAAFLSDLSPGGASQLLVLHVGDPLGWDGSRVEAISLDGLRLSDGRGSSRTIMVGQKLENDLSRPASSPPGSGARGSEEAVSVAPGMRLPGEFYGNGPVAFRNRVSPDDPPLMPGSADDLEQRMRARRAMQLGTGPAR
jgi:hypothetical protein